MNVDLGEVALDVAQKLFVPVECELGMQAALHENLLSTEGDGLFDLAQQLFARKDVAFLALGRSVKRTKVTNGRADVRVVDVSVDIVCTIGFRMHAARDGVGRTSQRGQILRLKQP